MHWVKYNFGLLNPYPVFIKIFINWGSMVFQELTVLTLNVTRTAKSPFPSQRKSSLERDWEKASKGGGGEEAFPTEIDQSPLERWLLPRQGRWGKFQDEPKISVVPEIGTEMSQGSRSQHKRTLIGSNDILEHCNRAH